MLRGNRTPKMVGWFAVGVVVQLGAYLRLDFLSATLAATSIALGRLSRGSSESRSIVVISRAGVLLTKFVAIVAFGVHLF